MKSMVVVGVHAAVHALKNTPSKVQALFIDKKREKALQEIQALAKENNKRITLVETSDLDKKAGRVNHQGVVTLLEPLQQMSEYDVLETLQTAPNPLVILLDEVQDPQNVGAILRSAAAFGAHAVFAPERNACGLTPVVRKAASGGDLIVPFVQVKNLARLMRALQEINIWLVGTQINEEASPITDIDLRGPIGLVMGSEGTGLRQNTLKHCDYIVHLPLPGPIPSLNVSVATGICLYECWRQREKPTTVT